MEHWGSSEKSGCPAFGIALVPEFMGKGYGTEAQLLFVDYLLISLAVHVEGSHRKARRDNEQSIADILRNSKNLYPEGPPTRVVGGNSVHLRKSRLLLRLGLRVLQPKVDG